MTTIQSNFQNLFEKSKGNWQIKVNLNLQLKNLTFEVKVDTGSVEKSLQCVLICAVSQVHSSSKYVVGSIFW